MHPLSHAPAFYAGVGRMVQRDCLEAGARDLSSTLRYRPLIFSYRLPTQVIIKAQLPLYQLLQATEQDILR